MDKEIDVSFISFYFLTDYLEVASLFYGYLSALEFQQSPKDGEIPSSKVPQPRASSSSREDSLKLLPFDFESNRRREDLISHLFSFPFFVLGNQLFRGKKQGLSPHL